MSAEILRKAADELRECPTDSWGRAIVPFDREVWVALADLLDTIAEHDFQDIGPAETCTSIGSDALAMARLVLGGSS